MSDAHHCSSKPAVLQVKSPGKLLGKTFALALLALSAGCASTGFPGLSLNANSGDTKLADNKPIITGSITAAKKNPRKNQTITGLIEAVSTSEAYPGKRPVAKSARNSAWCRYLDANTRAQNAILRSPTVSGDINDEGNGGVSISYDFVDLARAKLKEEAASVRCKRYLVSNRLARLMIIAPQSLTLAGNRAKADFLKSKRGELNAIKAKIKAHITSGEMTVQLGTALMQHAETIASNEFRARAEALRRASIGKMDTGRIIGLDSELVDVERTLQEIDRRSRSVEALKVSISAGYGYQGDSGISSNSGYGKLKLSYRLGAISPVRQEYEDIAVEARVAALREKDRGMLWRSNEMSQAIARAYGGMLAQRNQLRKALAEARRNTAVYAKGYEIEMLQPRYRAQIDEIGIEANLRGINATLQDMKRIERNLQFK